MIILFVVLGVVAIIDYCKTRDNDEISPEDLKILRKKYFFLLMFLCATIIVDHIDRILLS